jgi:hypothetical protein
MSATGTTVQDESYVYGGVLFQRVTEADSAKPSHRTGIGTRVTFLITRCRTLTYRMLNFVKEEARYYLID